MMNAIEEQVHFHERFNEELRNLLMRLENYVSDDVDEQVKLYTEDGVPIRKLFIGNIAQRTTHKDLEKLFSTYGKVDGCFLKRNIGRNNYAFVTFSNIYDALSAARDGYRKKIHLHNRDLRVMPADSWHQPDSIEKQNKRIQKKVKSDETEISTNYILNEDADIHKLNDDCLMHIFTFLPIMDRVRIERVCRRWRVVSQESWCTFKKLDLSKISWGFNLEHVRKIDTPTLRKVLLRCGQFLSHIDLSLPTHKLCSSTLTVVGKLCPNLQNVDVTALYVSPAGIKALTTNCTNITELSIGSCTCVCDSDFSQLFLKNKKLRYIKFVQNSLTGKCLLNLPADSIETIIFDKCINVSPCHFYTAVQTFTKLHTLSLTKCVSFNDQAVKAISLCSKTLKHLDLCDRYPMIKSNSMLHIAELINLERLNVSNNVLVNDKFLDVVGTHCKQLKSVDINCCYSVTNKGLAEITSLPNLEELSISYLGIITDEVLSDMPKLRIMYCCGCPNLHNAGLCTLVEEAHNIETLDLSGCNYISNSFIKTAINATKNRTNNIVLKMYVGGTSVNMQKISAVSPYLQVFNVDLSKAHLRQDFDHDEDYFFPDNYEDYEAYYNDDYDVNSDDDFIHDSVLYDF